MAGWLEEILGGISSQRDMGLPADRPLTGGAPAPAENAPVKPGVAGQQDPLLALVEGYQAYKRRAGREPLLAGGNVRSGSGRLGETGGSERPPAHLLGSAVNRSGNARQGQAFSRFDMGDNEVHVYYTGGKRRVVVVPKRR